ncbi:Biotin/lipoate A/B protein ligase [Tulasnella sp. JGI-2019a]|nr:Biotin/lipoate A/B protein ligase [Tulasnella sp. JGI-2019a]KAG9016145.1 Biotin/lipoate A/B protein ligase [Tulasnella sp. JGI-2019a]
MIFKRAVSSVARAVTAPKAFVSHSVCPYFNLALEDWIFRNTPPEIPLLLIYRNRPSVIIGRNQNPWKEINLEALHRLGIPFVRRRSGGGTVYHDLGNTNYSVLVPRATFARRPNAELVARAVQSLGPPALVNDRNDIVVEGFKICHLPQHAPEPLSKTDTGLFSGLYVSGSAYKIVNKRAYHHGTMLIDAQLGQLGDVLHNTKVTMVTKGVASVRSSVRNLRNWAPEMTHESFTKAVVQEFQKTYGGEEEPTAVDDALLDEEPAIKANYEDLQTWNWTYGQTPEFEHHLSKSFEWGDVSANIQSKHGRIISASLQYAPPLTANEIHEDAEDVCLALAGKMIGDKYGSLEGLQQPDGVQLQSMERDIIRWLQQEM